ncbi:hypothetical protein E2C01_069261 [Portunus trituberculatus]|uniref:Uncharacterized protein n=1 Tax=Portunus trituberculatus TaxID=210409 RepID=A0A5B7HU26_PORTR|nr:hypothetical protein [Portunus trituberculatus]
MSPSPSRGRQTSQPRPSRTGPNSSPYSERLCSQ